MGVGRIAEYVVSVTTTGSAGSATGSADTPSLDGEVIAVRLDYHASAPASTKVDIDEVGGSARKILNKAASATDVTHFPHQAVQDNTGAAITGGYERFLLDGRKLRVTVTLSNALTGAVVATILVLEKP
jgi:hypothetical protein